MTSAQKIIAADAAARWGFTYRADPARQDKWRSFATDVLAGKQWSGDCDDLASTTLDLLARAGADPTSLARAMVSTTGGDAIDHMIAVAVDDNGIEWIIGDTFGPAYPRSRCRHAFRQVSLVSEGTRWRKT